MGGTFTAYNKIRPGAYINFESLPKQLLEIGTRGIATMPVETNWGPDGVTELMTSDMINGNFEKIYGDTDRLVFELMLSQCTKALIYRANIGDKAKLTQGTLKIEAIYGGTFGNKIAVGVLAGGKVVTVVNGIVVDEQIITTYEELKNNAYVKFDGTGAFAEFAITLLKDGTNGTYNIDNYFDEIKLKKWNVMAMTDATDANIKKAIEFVKEIRDNEGIKAQLVVATNTTPDHEAVIKINQALMLNETEVASNHVTAYVAGVTAGANISQSNTFKKTPFTSIVNKMTNTQIEEALTNGYFVFTETSDGAVKIEQDINSFTSFSSLKGKEFRKNRVIRTIDEIGNTITSTFEKYYGGKVNNNEVGRTSLKSDLVGYFNNLQDLQAITNFAPEDVQIEKGVGIEEVIANVGIQPVDSMEKLYMTVKLG